MRISVIPTQPSNLRWHRRSGLEQNSQGTLGSNSQYFWLRYLDKFAWSGEGFNWARGSWHPQFAVRAQLEGTWTEMSLRKALPHSAFRYFSIAIQCGAAGQPCEPWADTRLRLSHPLHRTPHSNVVPYEASAKHWANAFWKNIVCGAVALQWTVNTVLAKTPSLSWIKYLKFFPLSNFILVPFWSLEASSSFKRR